MSDFRTLLETFSRISEQDRVVDPNVSYREEGKTKAATAAGDIDKVIAELKGPTSAALTKISKKYLELDEEVKRLTALREESKEKEMREIFGLLFAAEDAAFTRVIDTVSLTVMMKKDTEEVTSEKELFDHEKFLTELATIIDSDLLPTITALADKHTSVKKTVSKGKVGAIMQPKMKEARMMNEANPMSMVKTYIGKLSEWANLKLSKYDARLDDLRARYQQAF